MVAGRQPLASLKLGQCLRRLVACWLTQSGWRLLETEGVAAGRQLCTLARDGVAAGRQSAEHVDFPPPQKAGLATDA